LAYFGWLGQLGKGTESNSMEWVEEKKKRGREVVRTVQKGRKEIERRKRKRRDEVEHLVRCQ
jgi:hypothetical protein